MQVCGSFGDLDYIDNPQIWKHEDASRVVSGSEIEGLGDSFDNAPIAFQKICKWNWSMIISGIVYPPQSAIMKIKWLQRIGR
ncbi:hypothetical protein L2E82_21830 [Cichorium intybus]|uniref:Uncharacterized protein n=1 Tax=Cichorium intybus TaxID=13427 RepID=A0ACB9DW48_CICIN|nr:hypothetical protein L2E82_21830 [Cichorium intybus]